jgi:outer membrane protein
MRAIRALLFAVGLSFTGAVVLAPAAAHAEQKVAVVDMQEVIEKSSAAEKARARIQGAISQKQAAIQGMEADLTQRIEAYEKQKLVLSPEARSAKEQELGQAQMTFQQTYMQAQQEIQALEQQLMAELFEKVRPICGVVAKEKGYSLVVEANSGVLWAADGLDITADVIKRFNAGG